VEKMFDVYPTPAYTNEIIRIYKAVGLKQSKIHLDEDEFLESYWAPKDKLREMIKNGEIKDAKTLIALLAVL
jgi:ADP-ribose pyrophosphatase